MKHLAVAFASGLIFAVGLGVSGMTDPQRILGFLDVAGSWDPSLALVMLGAIAVHVGPAQWALRAGRPILAGKFDVTNRTQLDAPLVIGSALFGMGWGIAGYCPGPALVDLIAPTPGLLTFVAAMVGGMAVFRFAFLSPAGGTATLSSRQPRPDASA
jgi:uncharacterized membrane protein YedE/YeeE